MKAHFILYVADQALSTAFYTAVLDVEPTMNVPGMTEFMLEPNCVLGLMPKAGAERMFDGKLKLGRSGERHSGAEVYLIVEGPAEYHRRALAAGAVELSGIRERDWGHRAAYSLDPDAYVLAFAETISS